LTEIAGIPGSLTRPQLFVPPIRWRLPPQPELIQSLLLLLLVLDVVSDHFLVSPYGRDKVASRPNMIHHQLPLARADGYGPMAPGQMVPIMSPGPFCARTSALTSLHHPPRCHRQRPWSACDDWIHLTAHCADQLRTAFNAMR
jgi:hypothetical protein